MRNSHRRLPFVALFSAVLVLATGCGGDKKDAAATTTTAPGSTTTSPASPTATLTGLPLAHEAPRNRPPLTIQIDHPPAARPQLGIQHADVIVEEKVEGGKK